MHRKMGKKKNPQSGDWGKERKESDVAGIGYEWPVFGHPGVGVSRSASVCVSGT